MKEPDGSRGPTDLKATKLWKGPSGKSANFIYYYIVKERRATDFDALELRKGR